MFQGHSVISLDEKGRIIIPSKFRKHILPEANGIMHVTLGRDSCLWLYPSYEWNKLLNVIDGLNPFLKDEIAMKRQMMFHADECLIDSQHRILVPNTLLQKVDIKKEVLFIGQLDKIELWNPLTYEKYLKASSETYEDVMEKVMSKNPDRNT